MSRSRTTRTIRVLELHHHRLVDVDQELRAAEAAHGPYLSAHEGLAVILEEVDELRDVVFDRDPVVREAKSFYAKGPGYLRTKLKLARAEALQVAATAVRFVELVDRKLEELEEDVDP